MMRRRDLIALLLVGIFAAPGALLSQDHAQHHRESQEHQAQQGMMQMGQGHGMMGMMTPPSPGMILKQKDALKLSEAQVQRLEALQKQLDEVHKGHMGKAHPLHSEVMGALQAAKLDLAKYESALKKLADEHVKMQVELARFSGQALDVLTPDQRSNLHYGMRLMRGMMQEGGAMGAGCPMMGTMQHESK